jgi:type III pantothenate kinase
MGLFIEGTERRIETTTADKFELLAEALMAQWEEIPMSKSAKKPVKDGFVVVSSVKPEWTKLIALLVKEKLGTNILLIGKDIDLPMEVAVDEPKKVGTDRIVTAAAAYAVVEQALVVADFGTAITIDLVDEKGVFLGGIIAPGMGMSAKALHENTSQLPMVKLKKPQGPYGSNTDEAITAGIYYGTIGMLQEVVRRYAEKLEKWPYTIITGGDAGLIHEDCDFVDAYVPHLAIKGIALAFRNYLDAKAEGEEAE